MKAETAAYLDKARRDLDDAEAIAAIAARSAYYAAFHAAEAFILERSGEIAKTHSGVRTMLARLSLTHPEIDKRVLTFLGQGYLLQGNQRLRRRQQTIITIDEARDALVEAKFTIETIAAALHL